MSRTSTAPKKGPTKHRRETGSATLRWQRAQEALGAVLVWDDSFRRMLLCCNDDDGRLTIWQLTEAGWELVVEGKGSPRFVLIIAAHEPSSRTVRIVAGKQRWSLAGSALTSHTHRSPHGIAGGAGCALWDREGKRLLVSGGDDSEGIGATIPDGAACDFDLPVPMELDAVAVGDRSVLAVTSTMKGTGELRVIRNGKVTKKTAIPLGPTTVAWNPGRNEYVVRTFAKKHATTWAYAAEKGTLAEIGCAAPAGEAASGGGTKSTKSKPAATRPVWLLKPGRRGRPGDQIFSPTVRGLVEAWPTCVCGEPMHHCVTAMRGPGLALKKHAGIAVFFCDDPMCESWVPNGGCNKVVFIGKSKKVFKGPTSERTRPFARIVGAAEALDDEDTSDAAKLGGHPHWVQSPESVTCAECGEAMDFALQIGAEIRDFGDAGIGYVFLCRREHAGAALWQGC